MIRLCTECSVYSLITENRLQFSYQVLDSVAAGYKKLRNRIGKLTNDGEINQELVKEYKENVHWCCWKWFKYSFRYYISIWCIKEDTNEATKLAIINDFDKVLSLDLTKGAIEEKKEENIDSELETYINEMIAKRAEAKKKQRFLL